MSNLIVALAFIAVIGILIFMIVNEIKLERDIRLCLQRQQGLIHRIQSKLEQ